MSSSAVASLAPVATPAFDMQADFFDALSADDIGRAAQVLADDVLFLFPGIRPVHGKALTTRMLRVIRRRFLDIRWTRTMSIQAEPDWLISTWSVTGTFVGGGVYRNEVVSIVRLDQDGKVAYLSDYFKSTDFTARAAGAAPQLEASLAV